MRSAAQADVRHYPGSRAHIRARFRDPRTLQPMCRRCLKRPEPSQTQPNANERRVGDRVSPLNQAQNERLSRGELEELMTKSKGIRSSQLIDDGVEELDADMRASDIVWALERLKFIRGHCLLRIDKDIRQFLVRALQNRG